MQRPEDAVDGERRVWGSGGKAVRGRRPVPKTHPLDGAGRFLGLCKPCENQITGIVLCPRRKSKASSTTTVPQRLIQAHMASLPSPARYFRGKKSKKEHAFETAVPRKLEIRGHFQARQGVSVHPDLKTRQGQRGKEEQNIPRGPGGKDKPEPSRTQPVLNSVGFFFGGGGHSCSVLGRRLFLDATSVLTELPGTTPDNTGAMFRDP